jgi:ketosteroid isomerase-like protein
MDATSGLRFVEAMERAVAQGDRAGAAAHLSEDVAYTVGARPPVRGIDAVFAALDEQGRLARWDGHTFHAAWFQDDALVIEVTSHFTRVADGRRISFPCTDIYRFRDGRIADWRVYADMAPFFAP